MGSPAPEAEGQGGPVVIHAWSAPRSLSTSLMYSFAQVRRAPLRSALLVGTREGSTPTLPPPPAAGVATVRGRRS
jgi:hypothetical protein